MNFSKGSPMISIRRVIFYLFSEKDYILIATTNRVEIRRKHSHREEENETF
jgi:hypothetical protein